MNHDEDVQVLEISLDDEAVSIKSVVTDQNEKNGQISKIGKDLMEKNQIIPIEEVISCSSRSSRNDEKSLMSL